MPSPIYGGSSSAPTRVFNGRLTLESNIPVPSKDQLAKTNIYWTPFRGNQISLYDGAAWNTRTFSELTLALGTLSAGVNYDVFLYDNAGTVAFDTVVAWRSAGVAIINATNATPIVIGSVGHALQNGDEVYISGVQGNTAANGTWIVANKAADTFELTGSVGNGVYTATTGTFSARSTLLAKQDGVLVKTGATTRLYVGTFRTVTTTTTESSEAFRFLWNYYNRVPGIVTKYDATSHSYGTATYREWNNSAANRIAFVIGVEEDSPPLFLQYSMSSQAAAGRPAIAAALNTITAVDSLQVATNGSSSAGTLVISGSAPSVLRVSAGHNYIAVLQISIAGTNTYASFRVTLNLPF